MKLYEPGVTCTHSLNILCYNGRVVRKTTFDEDKWNNWFGVLISGDHNVKFYGITTDPKIHMTLALTFAYADIVEQLFEE